MKIIELLLRQRTFIGFFAVLCVFAGLASYMQMGKLEDPEFTVKTAVVVTLYPGATADEVENHVTDNVEIELQTLENLYQIRSLSRPGVSMIFVDLKSDLNNAQLPQEWDLLRRKVTDVKTKLPATAQISIVQDEFSEVYGMLFSVTGKNIENSQLREYAKEFQRRINDVDGIRKVELHGVTQPVVNIDIDKDRLVALELSPMQLISQIQAQDARLNAGSIAIEGERLRLEHPSALHTIRDIENIAIQGRIGFDGNRVVMRLSDIATISLDDKKPSSNLARYNGDNAIVVAVSPSSGVNVVSLGDQLTDLIEEFERELPLGISVDTIAFQPDEVNEAVNDFLVNLLQSLLIVVVTLWFFMGAKSSAIVGISLVMSILLTLSYMNVAGIDLQRVSLGSFILALGILVDNAIVITDLFKVKCRQGLEPVKAAASAVKEMAIPLLGATVIAIMGVLPVLLATTEVAEFSISVWQVMCSSLLFSWLIAMTLTPVMCLWWLKPEADKDNAGNESKGGAFSNIYRKALTSVIRKPQKVLLVLTPLVVATLVALPHVNVNFMPSSTRPIVFLDYWLPNGANLDQTSSDLKKIESWLLEQPEVKDISTFVGASAPRFSMTVEPEPDDPAYGQVLINTKDHGAIEGLVERGDKWLAENFPNAEPRFRPLKMATADKFSIEARFIGPDPVVLRGLVEEAKLIMNEHSNTKYVRDDWRRPSKKITPQINLEEARLAGIHRSDIGAVLRAIDEGLPVASMHLNNRQVPINLRVSNVDLETLPSLPVQSQLGSYSVPLGQVVDSFELGYEQSIIYRRDRLPVITAQADVFGETASEVRKQLEQQLEAIELPRGYRMVWGGEYYDEHRVVKDVFDQLPTASVIMIIIMVALFNSLKQPAIILFTVPLAATGATFALLGFGKPFGFMALTGAICLSGMIIKNGIVLMDQIGLELKKGVALDKAIEDATLNRTLAISMSALTTALGMIPLLNDALFDQMAATIIGGLIVATILSLFVMPALYSFVFRKQEQLNGTPVTEESKHVAC
ncbi:efflux RND transporter permease subunit [Vibrio comitans]|uniref:Transporter n=1 Tax=Vibrio comitans NBRC 102076 TaxID=1219078 RepID=A0A4Y3IT34_9VIBR|nr:efflux RND transporter permease subunit [Vibrio comitans]GEA62292.1 transporter [Vibrio comitans NBRC 102076]